MIQQKTIHLPNHKRGFHLITSTILRELGELPETGMGLEWERLLSPVFVKSEIYGTRASSVLIFDKNNKINFRENAWLEKSLTKKTEFIL